MKFSYDVVVVGAGIAGISAAVKSAREGASTLLIEHYGFVGGMSTAGMVSPFMKHSINNESLVRGVFEDLEIEMQNMNGMIDNGFYANSFRSAAFGLLEKAGVDIFLLSDITKVNRNNNKITSMEIVKSSEEIKIDGKIFIDTSGDAQLVYLGNFPWTKGDEKNGNLQALTLFFRMGGIDIKKATNYVNEHREDFFNWVNYDFDFSKIISVAGYFSNVKKAILEKRLPEEIEYIFYTTLPESGEASFNTSNILGLDGSTSYELTNAELKGRDQVYKIVLLLQKEIPGFENSYLLETAVQVGVRETRRAIGDYIMNGDEIKHGAKFKDAIARGCYGIDIHGQKGETSRLEEIPAGQYYEIPLRSLIVKEAENLLVAGRCISATREAHSALRIMATSAATGEACGALASVAVKQGTLVRNIHYSEVQKLIPYNLSL
ncbi:MAG: FAD-dependent oxidoreductase [Ignavibacteriales bacterium]|nr:FAD-dependent oxidoreductase [Ignavibacteriales bacterium]